MLPKRLSLPQMCQLMEAKLTHPQLPIQLVSFFFLLGCSCSFISPFSPLGFYFSLVSMCFFVFKNCFPLCSLWGKCIHLRYFVSVCFFLLFLKAMWSCCVIKCLESFLIFCMDDVLPELLVLSGERLSMHNFVCLTRTEGFKSVWVALIHGIQHTEGDITDQKVLFIRCWN